MDHSLTVVITSDEPYGEMKHTQLLYAEFLAQQFKVIYLAPPNKWRIFNLFSKAIPNKEITASLTIMHYHNALPSSISLFKKFNENRNERSLVALLGIELKVLVWHFDSYRSSLNSGLLAKNRILKRLYHVIDPFYNNPIDRELCRSSELIVLTSARNKKHYSEFTNKIKIVPQGLSRTEIDAVAALPKHPTKRNLILLGTISTDLDFEWLDHLSTHVEAEILLIGKKLDLGEKEILFQKLIKGGKIRWLKEMPPAEFYPLLKTAAAGLVVYNEERRNKVCSPLKALNYLAAEIPVICNIDCEIPSLLNESIWQVNTVEQMSNLCKKAIGDQLTFNQLLTRNYLEVGSLESSVNIIFQNLGLPILPQKKGRQLKKIRGTIMISNVTKALEHEWFANAIDKEKFDLNFVLFNAQDSELHKYLVLLGFSCTNHKLPNNRFIPYFVFIYWLRFLFARPDFVHAHLFQAGIIGTVAAKLAGIKKRIYTRHHSDMHHMYHQHAIKYDLLVNRLSTHIIAVSKNGSRILTQLEKTAPEKITIINHGIPAALMDREIPRAEIAEISTKYSLEGKYPVIGVISRFVPEKGIQYIVPAFKRLLVTYPDAKLVLANAKGVYTPEINMLLSELPPAAFVQVPFELKIDALFKNFTMFLHAPINERAEAFGQVYLESMCLGIPMICTIAGIAESLVKDRSNAIVAQYASADSIYDCMTELLNNDLLRRAIIEQAHQDVKVYTFEKKFEQIMSIYLN